MIRYMIKKQICIKLEKNILKLKFFDCSLIAKQSIFRFVIHNKKITKA